MKLTTPPVRIAALTLALALALVPAASADTKTQPTSTVSKTFTLKSSNTTTYQVANTTEGAASVTSATGYKLSVPGSTVTKTGLTKTYPSTTGTVDTSGVKVVQTGLVSGKTGTLAVKVSTGKLKGTSKITLNVVRNLKSEAPSGYQWLIPSVSGLPKNTKVLKPPATLACGGQLWAGIQLAATDSNRIYANASTEKGGANMFNHSWNGSTLQVQYRQPPYPLTSTPSPPGTQPIKTSCGQTVYLYYIFEGSPRVSIQYTTQVAAATS
jgi:hypothetical protein